MVSTKGHGRATIAGCTRPWRASPGRTATRTRQRGTAPRPAWCPTSMSRLTSSARPHARSGAGCGWGSLRGRPSLTWPGMAWSRGPPEPGPVDRGLNTPAPPADRDVPWTCRRGAGHVAPVTSVPSALGCVIARVCRMAGPGISGTVRARLQEGEGHLTLTVTSRDRILDDPPDMAGLTV